MKAASWWEYLRRLARRSLALRPAHSRYQPIRDTLTRGFSHFVTSMTAPAASGWSVCRVGLAPTGKRRLVTAHTPNGHWVAASVVDWLPFLTRHANVSAPA